MKRLWAGGPYYTDDPVFKITTDSVLLADFASNAAFHRCMDLGCGGGLVSVMLHAGRPDAIYDGVDIRREAVDTALDNYDANDIQGQILCRDARQYRTMTQPGGYELVVCNPPYYYNNRPSPDTDRAAARQGVMSPAQFSGAAAYLLKRGGEFCLVHKPEFLTDIFAAMRLADIEPKRLRLVCHTVESAPALVLIAGRRGGRPGLTAMPYLILCHSDGSPTEEIRRIYHMRDDRRSS